MVQRHNFLGLLIIYLALQHCLQNPNTTFQYRDMSHQMTWYILAHMPYFRRPGHVLVGAAIKSTEASSWDEAQTECMHFNPYFSRKVGIKKLHSVCVYLSCLFQCFITTRKR